MPQMSPLSWTSLLMMFIILFMIILTLNYFCLNSQIPDKDKKNKNKNFTLNWKW